MTRTLLIATLLVLLFAVAAVHVETEGDYELRVSTSDPIRLTVNGAESPLPQDALEPNNTSTTARNLGSGDQQRLEGHAVSRVDHVMRVHAPSSRRRPSSSSTVSS